MPHSTSDGSGHGAMSNGQPAITKFANDMRTTTEPFPQHVEPSSDHFAEQPSNLYNPIGLNGDARSNDRWVPRKESSVSSLMKGSSSNPGRGHGRQKSLSDALRTIRTRRASVSANAQEIADALKAPVSPKLIILCIIWYFSSALTNTSSKSILNAFEKPATLTLVQFAFVASFCVLFSWLAGLFPSLKSAIPALRYGIRTPTRDVIMTTLPLAGFQVGGHLLSSAATSRMPVPLVHTIKGLSPLFTVFAYRVFFNIRYPMATYLSFIPLTVGVMMACSAEFKGNIIGILCAFLAAIIFVTQNIFSKRLFNEAAKSEADGSLVQSRKLDKLNLLCYSSGLAFVLTAPIWFWSEGASLLWDFFHHGSVDLTEKPEAFDHGRLALEFVFNGIFHFGQNIVAFVLLSMVSPVTYSVASLIKRVFVVVIAIIWFRNKTTRLQAAGIALTFFGLYLYDRTSHSNKADRKARMMDIKEETLLPLNTQSIVADRYPPVFDSPITSTTVANPQSNGFANGDDNKRAEDTRRGQQRGNSKTLWLPPGTRQEETWHPKDISMSGKTEMVG